MKKFRTCICFLVALLTMIFFGQEKCYAQSVSELDDPEYWKSKGYVSEEFYEDDENGGYPITPLSVK